MKKLLSVILALCICAGVLVSCGKKDAISLQDLKNDPAGIVAQGFNTSLTSSKLYTEFFETEAAGIFTYEFSVDIENYITVNANAVADYDSESFSGDLTAEFMDMEVSADLWSDGKAVALSVPEILGDAVYGVSLESLGENLEDSLLLGDLTVEELIDAISEGNELFTAEDVEGYLEDITTVGEGIANKLGQALSELGAAISEAAKSCECTATSEKWTAGGGSVAASKAVFTFGKSQVDSVMDAFVDFIQTFAGDTAPVDTDAPEDISGTVTVWLNNATGAVMETAVAISAEESSLEFDIILGEDIAKKTDFSVTAKMDGETRLSFAVSEPEEENTDGVIISFGADGANTALSFKRNVTTGEYNATFSTAEGEDDKTEITATGVCKSSAESFELTVDSLKLGAVTVEPKLRYAVTAGGTVEAVPEYTELVTLTEEELQELVMTAMTSELGSLIVVGGTTEFVPEYTEEEIRREMEAIGYTEEYIDRYVEWYFDETGEVEFPEYTEENLRAELSYIGYTESYTEDYIEWYFDETGDVDAPEYTEEDLRAEMNYYEYPSDYIDEYVDYYFNGGEEPELPEETDGNDVFGNFLENILGGIFGGGGDYSDEDGDEDEDVGDYPFGGDDDYTEEDLRRELEAVGYTQAYIDAFVEWFFGDGEFPEYTEEDLRAELENNGYDEDYIEEFIRDYFDSDTDTDTVTEEDGPHADHGDVADILDSLFDVE